MCFSLNVSKMDKEKNEWLAKYYSPSMWNKRMNPGEVADYHVNICTSYSETSCKNSHCELSVCYGEKKAKMDIFYPLQETDETAVSVKKSWCTSSSTVCSWWVLASREQEDLQLC